MKAFIDYFWNQEGYSYDPLGGQTLSTYHIIMLIICIITFMIFWIIGKKIRKKGGMLIASIILFILIYFRLIFCIKINYNWIVIFHLFNK